MFMMGWVKLELTFHIMVSSCIPISYPAHSIVKSYVYPMV